MLVVAGSFASEVPTLNYSDIVSQYSNKQPISNISDAIKIVEDHYKSLKAQRVVYRPGALRLLGTGLGLVAGVGIIGSVGGAYGAYTIFNNPENSLGRVIVEKTISEGYLPSWFENKVKQYKGRVPLTERGLSYSDFLNQGYFGAKFPTEKEFITDQYLDLNYDVSKNPMGAAMVLAGIAAPVALPISLLLAGLSKYLFNKAASYQDPALEDLIAQDEKMLKDLRAMQ